jgi:RNA polymerase sigma-70 factor (ECF subfamily)
MYSQTQNTTLSAERSPETLRRPLRAVPDPRAEIVEHLRPMRAFAMSLTRDHARADDVVQETILKAWSNIEKFEPGTNMRAWLFTILRNTFYSERRRAAREVPDHDGAMSERMAVKPDHDGRLALADFRRAFETLPDVQREALMLVGGEGFAYEEAAAMCGCAVGTIKSRANRGRRRLAVLLQLGEGEHATIADHATMAVIGRNPWA